MVPDSGYSQGPPLQQNSTLNRIMVRATRYRIRQMRSERAAAGGR